MELLLKIAFGKNMLQKISNYWFLLPLIIAVVYMNLISSVGFIHTDDHEYYFMGTILHETGSLSYSDPYAQILDGSFFVPLGSLSDGENIIPKRPYGMFYIISFGLLFGKLGPFWLVGILGVLGAVFWYKLILLLFDKKVAVLAGFAYSTSLPVIYWSSMLMPNIIALSTFVFSLYLLFKELVSVELEKKKSIQFLYFFLMAVATIWLRYEYVLFYIITAFVVLVRYSRYFSIKNLFLSLFFAVLLILPIFILNTEYYDAPLKFGYTFTSKIQENTFEVAKEGKGILNSLFSLYDRFFRKIFHPNILRLVKNIFDWFIAIFPISFLSMFFALPKTYRKKEKNKNSLIIILVLISVIWLYDVSGGFHWGEGTNYVGSIYIRYLLPAYLLLFLGFSLFVTNLFKKNNFFLAYTFSLFFIIHNIIRVLMGVYGLEDIKVIRNSSAEINEIIQSLGDDSIIVSNLYSKMLLSKNVMDVTNSINKNDKTLFSKDLIGQMEKKQVLSNINLLVSQGFNVYLMEAEWHKNTFFNILKEVNMDKNLYSQDSIVFNSSRYGRIIIFKINND